MKSVPHVVFAKLIILLKALKGHRVIIAPHFPSPGVQVALIEVNGDPVELIQADRMICGDDI